MLQGSYLIQSAILANVFLFSGREAGRRGYLLFRFIEENTTSS